VLIHNNLYEPANALCYSVHTVVAHIMSCEVIAHYVTVNILIKNYSSDVNFYMEDYVLELGTNHFAFYFIIFGE